MQENKEHAPAPPQASSAFLHSSKLRNKLEKIARWRIDPALIDFPGEAREFRGGYATVSQGLLASPSSTEAIANESEHTAERPDWDARNLQPLNDTKEPKNDEQDGGEGQHRRTVNGAKDRIEEEGGKKPNNHEEQNSHPQISNSKIGNEAAFSEHTADGGPDSGDRNPRSRSDAQKPEDDQQGEDEGTENDQAKEVARKESDNTIQEQNSDHQSPKLKMVAVKKLKIDRNADLERILGLALRESDFLVKLSHPNIVKLEGFVEDLSERKVWLIFPWEEHGNLKDFLASGEWEIPERISLESINDVTLGLEYLHKQKPPIYHGDLKSVRCDFAKKSDTPFMLAKSGYFQLNILVNSKCHALITDFGSARHLGIDDAGKLPKENEEKPRLVAHPPTSDEPITLEALFSATASTLTLTGSGYTLRWAAPELLQDDKPCLRSDIWALGWIAYEVMTNTIPFHDVKKEAIVINRVVRGHLPSVTEDARMSLIRALCSLMVRCWSINPDKRPTAEECQKWISWIPMIVPVPVRTVDEEASQLRRAQVLNQLGRMYRRQADYVSAISRCTEALDIYTTHNDSKGRAETLLNLAHAHRSRCEYAETIALSSEALQISTDAGNEWERASSIFVLAETHRLRDEGDQAAKLYSECLQIYSSTGSKREKAMALWGLGEVHQIQARYSEAINLYSEALQIFTDVGDRRERAMTLGGLAGVHRFQQEYSEAINLYLEALQIHTDIGDHQERGLTLWSLAEVHRLQQEYSEARKLYSESQQVHTDIGDRQGRGLALWGLGEVHQALHEYDEATKLYSEAMQIFTDVDDKYWTAETLISLAVTNQKQGHSNEAISLYTEVSEVWEEMGDSRRASDALEKAADVRKTLQEATTDSAETVKVGEDPLPTSE